MDLLAALRYPFSDKQWLGKTTTAMFLLFIPLVGWAILAGYGLRIARIVAKGERRLPLWIRMGRDFSNGLLLSVGMLVYMMPLLLILCMWVVVSWIGGTEIAWIMTCCLGFLVFIYLMVITPLLYSAVAQFAGSYDLTEFFNLSARIQDTTAYAEQAVALVMISIIMWFLMALPLALQFGLLALLFSNPLLGCICLVVIAFPAQYALAILILAGFHITGQWGRLLGVR